MDVIQILVFLTVYACFPGKTYTSEFCHDFEGMPVRPGSEYYDGNSWRICRQNDDQLLKFMEEKWDLLFTMLDLNNDGVISEPDSEINQEGYVEVYKPLGVEESEISNLVDEFWKCVVLEDNSLPQEISKDRFIHNYKKTYTTDKDKGFEAIIKCNLYLSKIVDMDKDGFLSFDELFDDSRAWNEDNESVVRGTFEMMRPNNNNCLPIQNYAAFYSEFSFGESREHFATLTDIYSSYWLLCLNVPTEFEKQLMKFLEEKWELMFTMLDLNYDEVISEPDIEISKDSYVEVYKPLGVEETEIRNVVDDFWKCVVFEDNSLPQEISKDRFVRNYKKTYTTNKDKGFSAINKCDFYLLTMIDMNQDGFLSFGELFDDFRAWNEDNDSVVRDIFEMMGPNKNNFLPNQNYADFHAELAFGESREYYATTMDFFSSYGLYA